MSERRSGRSPSPTRSSLPPPFPRREVERSCEESSGRLRRGICRIWGIRRPWPIPRWWTIWCREGYEKLKMPMNPRQVEELISKELPGCEVTVQDLVGDGDHLQAVVVSSLFEGKGLLEQHQMVYG